MCQNIMSRVADCKVLIRYDVDYIVDNSSFDGFSGRAAHVTTISNNKLVELFCSRLNRLFN